MTIAEKLGLTPVKPFTSSKATPLPSADPSLLMGLELEIEGVPGDPTDWYVPGMYGEEDNSLRMNDYGRGWEFITKPATFSVASHILSSFFQKARLSPEKNYSERCSVHVHANIQDLTPDQLKSVCLLYQVFERMFYSFAGNDRDKNIFCVPWSETTITHKLIDMLMDTNLKALRNWQKYTGLNLIPVSSLGTIEFRHLPGTCDLQRLMDWMNLIGSLFATARKNSFDEIKSFIISVNTTSEYKHLVQRVFGEWERVLDMPFMETQLEDGVLDVKYMLASQTETKAKKAAVGMLMDELDAQQRQFEAVVANDARLRLEREARLRQERRPAAENFFDWNQFANQAPGDVRVNEAPVVPGEARFAPLGARAIPRPRR
jgi:Putative amidoligase enzyme